MWGKKKEKLLVDKIEKMEVYHYINDWEAAFEVQLISWNLTENAEKQRIKALEDFLLVANKKFCSGCYWKIYPVDANQSLYWNGDGNKDEFISKIADNNPIVSNVIVEGDYICILLNDMDASVFTMLKESEYPNGQKLDMDIEDVGFVAYHPDDLSNLDGEENDEATELNLSYGIINFPSRRINEAKECLIEAYTTNGIELDFRGERRKRKIYFEHIYYDNENIFDYLLEAMPRFVSSAKVKMRANNYITITIFYGIGGLDHISILVRPDGDKLIIKAWANSIMRAKSAVKLVRKILEAR